ncbi:hypothetical protein G9A89_021543 [Geosiphon pyriformis]|nr:hypothetical protein G9A89_021543 [Geosiphon pyriformis]
MSGTGAKRRSTRVPTSGSVSSGSSHKVKKPPGGAKLLSNGVVLKGSGSGQVVRQFNSMNTDGEASEGKGVSDSKMNTPQAKCFNNAVKGILATAKTHAIRKLFSGINGFGGATTPSKFEEIIKSTFTSEASMEKAASLARENNIIVNSDLKRQGVCSDQTIVIKEIPMDTPKEMIIATVSKFGQVVSIRLQLIGLWQKAVADQLAAKWSFLIKKNSVRVTKAASRDWYRALLFTLPVGTTAYDLGNLLAEAGGKTCNDEKLEFAFCMEPIFGEYGKLNHSVLECDAKTLISLTISKSFKRLAKLYVKKSVPISKLAAFSGKSWAQIVSLVFSSNGLHFDSGPGFGSSSGASGVIDHSSLAGLISLFLETRLTSLEHSLELLIDKVSGIIDKLDSLNLVLLALAFSFQPLVVSDLVNMEFGSDMVLDDPKSAVLLLSSVSSGAPSSGLSSSKILTLKMGCLESKLMALKASVCSVLGKLDQMCAGSGSVVSSVPQ